MELHAFISILKVNISLKILKTIYNVCACNKIVFLVFLNFFQPGLRDPRFSKRLQAYNDLRSNISQHTIKMNFLQRVHRYLLTTYSSEISLFYVSALNIFWFFDVTFRLKKHPSFKRKDFLPTRRRATLVSVYFWCISDWKYQQCTALNFWFEL